MSARQSNFFFVGGQKAASSPAARWGFARLTLGMALLLSPTACPQDSPVAPRVAEVRTDCDAGTVTVTFTKPVQLEGDSVYSLDNGAFVVDRHYGASAAEVVLATTLLRPGRGYALSISWVQDLDTPAHLLDPNPSVWNIHCVSPCGALNSHIGVGGEVIIEWDHPTGTLQTSTNLVSWSDLPFAASPFFVLPSMATARFYRLYCPGIVGGASPTILRHPDSFGLPAGATARFSAVATGLAPLSYQWFFNTNAIPNATSPTLSVENVSNANVGVYELRVANAAGSTISRPGLLYVLNDTGGLATGATMANPSVTTLLLSSEKPPDFPFNATLGQPPVSILIGTNKATRGKTP